MKPHVLTRATAIVLLAACADAPNAPTARLPAADAGAASAIWAETVTGNTGPGSLYALYKPVGWNGEVVYYAHGFVDAAAPVAIPATQDNAAAIRDALGTMGYAVAMSSYSSNGYDFDDGLRRTHQLRGLVRSQFGAPTRNWLVGHSLGAQISLGLAERHASQYDGALLFCGVVGGSRLHFNWLGNVRVLFDFFYPGVLPGNVTYMPPGTDLNTQIIQPAVAAITANPTPVFYIAAIQQTPLAGTNPNEIINSLVYALAWHARGIADVTDRAQGHLPYENVGVTYTGPAPLAGLLALLNATVPRYDSPPDAQAWLNRNFEPTGNVSFPVLTVHTSQDPGVPLFHEQRFGALVAAAGTGNLVVQRTINRYGHCTFTLGETLTAFGDLVNWVEQGVRPTP
jgi:pimeloyl-ACP methyl ester carboxylesterase